AAYRRSWLAWTSAWLAPDSMAKPPSLIRFDEHLRADPAGRGRERRPDLGQPEAVRDQRRELEPRQQRGRRPERLGPAGAVDSLQPQLAPVEAVERQRQASVGRVDADHHDRAPLD